MTTFLLVRHANHDWVGKALAGHLPGIHLNADGQAQAERLAERLSSVPIKAIYSSPLERARETADPISRRLLLPVQIRDRLTEIQYGNWQGKRLSELNGDPLWARYNQFPSSTRAPAGELLTEVQTRIVDELEELRKQHRDETVMLISHGDPIRVALTFYAGVPLDLLQRFEISPASFSILRLADWGPQILRVNDTVDATF